MFGGMCVQGSSQARSKDGLNFQGAGGPCILSQVPASPDQALDVVRYGWGVPLVPVFTCRDVALGCPERGGEPGGVWPPQSVSV